jgi:leukotriene-A4 hydrolase
VTVWGEPSVVDAAAHEFAETEQFLQAAESLTLPYAWTKYDVLCLPPSFPYGGMVGLYPLNYYKLIANYISTY